MTHPVYEGLDKNEAHVDSFYKKLGDFYNSLSDEEKGVYHARSKKITENNPDVQTLFADPAKRSQLEDYLKNTAGLKEPPKDEDILDSFF